MIYMIGYFQLVQRLLSLWRCTYDPSPLAQMEHFSRYTKSKLRGFEIRLGRSVGPIHWLGTKKVIAQLLKLNRVSMARHLVWINQSRERVQFSSHLASMIQMLSILVVFMLYTRVLLRTKV